MEENANTQLAIDVAKIIAQKLRAALPTIQESVAKGVGVRWEPQIRFFHDRGGALRCRISLPAPSAARPRPEVVSLALSDDQLELFQK